MRQKLAKETTPKILHFPDIKQKVPEAQLAKIGALALVFNELEAIIDKLFLPL